MNNFSWFLLWSSAIVGVFGIFTALADIFRAIEHRWPNRTTFKRIHGGIYIREPNGSEHAIQNVVEQYLIERGMRLYTLQRPAIEKLINESEWITLTTGKPLDIVIIGKIISKSCQMSKLKEEINPDDPNKYELIPGNTYTIDVRFYGESVQILGGFVEIYSTTENFEAAMEHLTIGLATKLRKTLHTKLVASSKF